SSPSAASAAGSRTRREDGSPAPPRAGAVRLATLVRLRSDSDLPGRHRPGGHLVEHRIVGTTMPVLELMLQPNEGVFAESGELAWISMSIQLRTGTTIGGQQGGFMAALGRVMAGSTIFMTEFTAVGGVGMAAFCARLPGELDTLELRGRRSYLVHRHGFMCATPGVQLGVGFQQRLGAGIFGGTGFRMQRLTGDGLAWVEMHGEVV